MNDAQQTSRGSRDTVQRTSSMDILMQRKTMVVSELGDCSVSSSAESSEDDDTGIDFIKNLSNVSEVPAEYFFIQKLMKAIATGNQNETIVAFAILLDCDLTTKLSHAAMNDSGALEYLVNILSSNHEGCRHGSMQILCQITKEQYMQRILTDLGIVSIIVEMLCVESLQMQMWAAEVIANLSKFRRAGRIVRKHMGMQRLLSMIELPSSILHTPRNKLNKVEENHLDLAIHSLNALCSLSQSSRNNKNMRRSGLLRRLSHILNSVHTDLIIPAMSTIQHCSYLFNYQVRLLYTNMFPDIIRQMYSDNTDLRIHSAMALFRCGNNADCRVATKELGGLEPLVKILREPETADNRYLLIAVLGAIWKCAINMDNALIFTKMSVVPLLLKHIDHETTIVIAHAAGGLAECAKIDSNRKIIYASNKLEELTMLLNRPDPSIMHANVCKLLGECSKDPQSIEVLDELDAIRLVWSLIPYPNKHVKYNATMALCPLIEYTKDSGEVVRSLLGGIKLVLDLLESRDTDIIECACYAIAKIAEDRENLAILTDHDIVDRLTEILELGNETLRASVSEAIANCCSWEKNGYYFGENGVVKKLVKLLTIHDPTVQRNVASCLCQMSADPFNCCLIYQTGIVPVLLHLTGSKDNLTQEAAAGCLSNLRRVALSLHFHTTKISGF